MPLLTSFLASAPGTTTLNATQVLQEILQDCLEKFLHYKTSALPGLSHVPLLLHAVYVVAHVLSCLYYVGTKSLNTSRGSCKTASRIFALEGLGRVALEAGQQQRSNARRHCTAGGSSGEREEERHGVAGC